VSIIYPNDEKRSCLGKSALIKRMCRSDEIKREGSNFSVLL
jgi:hypothetical protein